MPLADILELVDLLEVADKLWPHVTFYEEQKTIIRSVQENDETYTTAGNMLGKDFVAAFIVLATFLTRTPCRIVTTSTKDKHLNVLWGEMGRFIQECKYPLDVKRGGPLIINQRELYKVVKGERCSLSYVLGMVASSDTIQSFQGHHIAKTGDGIPRTMFVGDEASSLPDAYYTMVAPWANRMFFFGNPWECETFFRHAVEGKPGGLPGGDIKAEGNGHYYRKVIKITAMDSPNVRFGMSQKAKGKKPTNEMLIPGVLSYEDYVKRRATWDPILQCVSLDAEFYAGPQIHMYPRDWLEAASERKKGGRGMATLGVDSALGGDNTCWVALDKYGLLGMRSEKTPDTSVIPGITLGMMRQYGVRSENVMFDYGGGGKVHVDTLRKMKFNVRAVQFGSSATPEKKRGMTVLEERKRQDEIRMAFKNRRAEMYWMGRELIDPSADTPFSMPPEILDRPRPDGGPSLRRQLSVVPLWYDEGKLVMPPKQPKGGDDKGEEKDTMIKRTGCSPDEADAFVLAAFGQKRKPQKFVVGPMA